MTNTFDDLLTTLNGQAPTDQQLKEHFAPVFAQIHDGAQQREKDHQLAYEPIELLRESGFTRVRLGQEHGGAGASLPQLADLFISLAAADSNLPQALHGHFMFTEQHEVQSQGPVSAWWLSEVAAGKIFGNSLVELPPATGAKPVWWSDVESSQHADDVAHQVATISGDKFYSTGALFADYLLVLAHTSEDAHTLAVVDANDPGVTRTDDWNGFGQRLTASGSTSFDTVAVAADRTMNEHTPTGVLGYPFLWVVLVSTQAGIAQAALNDILEYVRGRKRTYEHAKAETPAEDPLVHEVVGKISAKVTAARHIARGAAAVLDESLAAIQGRTDLEDPVVDAAVGRANVELSEASLTISELVLAATNEIFEVGGASATDAAKLLHLHWLNARVISSHTPLIYRSQGVGDYRINGVRPPYHSTARDSTAKKAETDEKETL